MDELKFCVLRNMDDTLSVHFSDDTCILFIEEEEIDLLVFDYMPNIKKVQVFDLEQFQDNTCH